MSTPRNVMPRARTDDLAVEELLDETLVYDLARHKAHSLNRTATLVWRHCDGRTTVAEMAVRLAQELGVAAHEDLVWVALERLRRTHLLAERATVPPERSPYSRRDALRALGLTAALPVIVSILAPRAAHAQSCAANCFTQVNCTPCQKTPGGSCAFVCCNGVCVNRGNARQDCSC